MTKYKALFHIDEGNKFRIKLVLNNITNLLQDLGKTNVEVACIVNGAGIVHFKKENNEFQERIEELATEDVQFLICLKSLAPTGGKRDALLDVMRYVSSGVGEIVRKQTEGWVYIRP